MNTDTLTKAQYNRMAKRFGKINPEAVADEDLQDYSRYMEQRISKIDFYAERALRKRDDADSIRKGHYFEKRSAELKAMLKINSARLDRVIWQSQFLVDKNGQITMNMPGWMS